MCALHRHDLSAQVPQKGRAAWGQGRQSRPNLEELFGWHMAIAAFMRGLKHGNSPVGGGLRQSGAPARDTCLFAHAALCGSHSQACLPATHVGNDQRLYICTDSCSFVSGRPCQNTVQRASSPIGARAHMYARGGKSSGGTQVGQLGCSLRGLQLHKATWSVPQDTSLLEVDLRARPVWATVSRMHTWLEHGGHGSRASEKRLEMSGALCSACTRPRLSEPTCLTLVLTLTGVAAATG